MNSITDSVTTTHPLYDKRAKQWEVVRDCYEGEDAIKAKREKYLPRAKDTPIYQYNSYLTRARWVNYLGRTLNGLHGLLFRRSPVLTCPTEFRNSGIIDNIDRRGTSLNQFVADATHDMLITTFGGFLVDMPKTDGEISLYDAEQNGISPYVRYYQAESIINWKYETIKGVEQVSLVVLMEEVEDFTNDEFTHNLVKQYRVLDLKDGVYRQRLYRKINNNYVFEEIPVIINGEKLDYIPFVFTPCNIPDRPMLMDLAYCNIGHYQKSADYENGVHLTTIPTGYVTGHEQDVTDGEKEIINLGGDNFLMFPEADAKVGTLVYSGEGLTHSENALNMAMSEMAVLGSRLVSPDKNVSETADAAKIHRAGENALLATFAKNVSEKITRVLNIILDWKNIKGVAEYSLCTDYDTLAFDANALNALANLATNNKLPLPYLYYNLASGEYLPNDSSLEEYVTMLQMEGSGASPLEIAEHYRLLRSGKKTANSEELIEKYMKYNKQKDENAEMKESV